MKTGLEFASHWTTCPGNAWQLGGHLLQNKEKNTPSLGPAISHKRSALISIPKVAVSGNATSYIYAQDAERATLHQKKMDAGLVKSK